MHHSNIAGWASAARGDPARCSLQVLIVTSDKERGDRIAACLNRHRCHTVVVAAVPPAARLKADRYNLLVLDVQLAPVDGFEALRRVRAHSDIPVIMTSSGPRDDYDCLVGLELGADDFLGEPFNPRELIARGRAILRRHCAGRAAPAEQRGGYRFNGWEVDRRTRQVTAPDGSPVALSKSDYALLLAFLEAPGRPLTRVQLMRATRPHEDIYDRSIDVQVLRLRRKLRCVPGQSELIRTDRNYGYIFDAPVEPLF